MRPRNGTRWPRPRRPGIGALGTHPRLSNSPESEEIKGVLTILHRILQYKTLNIKDKQALTECEAFLTARSSSELKVKY